MKRFIFVVNRYDFESLHLGNETKIKREAKLYLHKKVLSCQFDRVEIKNGFTPNNPRAIFSLKNVKLNNNMYEFELGEKLEEFNCEGIHGLFA